MKDLKHYIQQINGIFRKEPDRYKAHALCRPILREMAEDRSVLFEIISRNLSRPGFLEQKRINPVIALDIEANETVSFVAHCWMPLPDRNTGITHQSIHHHGKLLLTSIAAFGPGYESVIFKKDFSIDKKTGETNMQVDRMYRNSLLNIEFIDVNTPHVVFYPSEFSITYALWTNDQSSASENLKKFPIINKYKKQLRKMVDFLGASKVLGLNTIEYLDFYPEGERILAMKERIMYPVGSNLSFVKGFFSFLQTVEYNDSASVEKAITALSKEKNAIRNVAEAFFKGEKTDDHFETIHLNIRNVNISKEALSEALNMK